MKRITSLLTKQKPILIKRYEKSERKLAVLDIQGSGYTLYDPEIASEDLIDDDGNYQFCTGNLSTVDIERFFRNHKCNKYCALLKLSK